MKCLQATVDQRKVQKRKKASFPNLPYPPLGSSNLATRLEEWHISSRFFLDKIQHTFPIAQLSGWSRNLSDWSPSSPRPGQIQEYIWNMMKYSEYPHKAPHISIFPNPYPLSYSLAYSRDNKGGICLSKCVSSPLPPFSLFELSHLQYPGPLPTMDTSAHSTSDTFSKIPWNYHITRAWPAASNGFQHGLGPLPWCKDHMLLGN